MKNNEIRLGRPSLYQRAGVMATAFLGSMMTTMATVFADGTITDITSGVQSGMSQIYTLIKGILLPIAAVALALCLLGMLFGGQKGMEKGKQYGIIVVLVIAGIYLAPIIVNTISGWFNGAGDAGVFG